MQGQPGFFDVDGRLKRLRDLGEQRFGRPRQTVEGRA
jgi:hypothetical protein